MATADNKYPIQSILIIRFSAMGDVVCTLPLLDALHQAFPQAAIDWLVEEKAAGLLYGHPNIRHVFVYPRAAWYKKLGTVLLSHLWKLRKHRYDVAFDVQGNLKSALNLLFVRARRKIGFARGFEREGNFLFVPQRVKPPGHRIHRVQKNLCLLNPLGISITEPRLSKPHIDAAAARRVNQFLQRDGLTGKPLAILHPGTSVWGQDKQWPPERFGALAARLAEELGFLSVITWGPGERNLADQVGSLSGGHARVAFGTQSLQEFVALISKASLFVAGDTGALQIASFLGVPTVGIFGPTDPVIYGPLGLRSVAAQPPELLQLPEKRDRSKRSELMMKISVEQVFQLVKAVLELK